MKGLLLIQNKVTECLTYLRNIAHTLILLVLPKYKRDWGKSLRMLLHRSSKYLSHATLLLAAASMTTKSLNP